MLARKADVTVTEKGFSLLSPPEHWTRFAGLTLFGKILRRTNSTIFSGFAHKIHDVLLTVHVLEITNTTGLFCVCGILNIFKSILK